MQDGQASADAGQGSTLHFRAAGLDDYSTIRHVHMTAVRALKDRLIEEADIKAAHDVIYSPAYVTELMRRSVTVATLNNDLVGTCAWSVSDDRGQSARIGSLFVLPLFQGRGFASQLIRHVEGEAARHGYKRYSSIVPVPALGLFDALGYATTSFGTSRDIVPGVAVQVAFVRKPQ